MEWNFDLQFLHDMPLIVDNPVIIKNEAISGHAWRWSHAGIPLIAALWSIYHEKEVSKIKRTNKKVATCLEVSIKQKALFCYTEEICFSFYYRLG